jgi:serine/threonine protein kinase
LAEHKERRGLVAVKTFEKARFLKDTKALLSLDKEISLLRQMDHPNIVRLYEVYENDLYVHLVLEYLGGGELHEQMRRKKKCGEHEARKLMWCVLDGLVYCHRRRIVHRDLKPENLMFGYGNE